MLRAPSFVPQPEVKLPHLSPWFTGTCTWGRERNTAPSRWWRRGGIRFRRGDILETRWSLKAPGPETAEIPAASRPGWSVPDGIRTRRGAKAKA